LQLFQEQCSVTSVNVDQIDVQKTWCLTVHQNSFRKYNWPCGEVDLSFIPVQQNTSRLMLLN
ncbi:hypothetical protein T05_3561, partial [Trichinella murrelli]